MKRLLTAFLMAFTIAGASLATTPQKAGATPPKGAVKLTQKQIETIRAVHPWMGQKPGKSKLPSSAAKLANLTSPSAPRLYGADKVNPSGSKIQGWRATDKYGRPTASKGWYELNLDGIQNLRWEYHDPDWVDDGWTDEPDFPFNAGFWRNGKVYGFHSEMLLFWLVWGHGTFTLDGEIQNYMQYGDNLDITDFSTYVFSCAYDAEKDMAYAYTLNADASAYQLQSVNPETWEFKVINPNVPIEDICIGFSYNPVDNKLYGVTPDGRFVTLDTTSGSLTLVTKFNLPVNTSIYGMTYSPLDKAFVVVIPGDNSTSGLYTIDPLNPQLNKKATLENTLQYRILVTSDKLIAPKAPLSAEIMSVDFTNGSTTGKASVKLPVKTFDESMLSGTLTLVANVDGVKHSEISGQPGETVEVPFKDITEGIRRFSFTVKSGDLESAEVDQNLYVGFDTPLAPQNIKLTEGTLTWDAVTGTVNNGYLDADNLTYNVYLNGEKINQSPITECTYTFLMPDVVYQKYVAQVEAVNHGNASDRGFSNDIKYGNPFPLPFSMKPTETEGELAKVISDRHQIQTWRLIEPSSGEYSYFSCRTLDYENFKNDWLFMPAVTIPESENLMEISFEVLARSGSDDNTENIAVGFGSAQDPDKTTIIKQWDNLTNPEWVKLTAYCLPKAGTSYIGFMTRTHNDGKNIRIRNISIRISDKPATTPAAPTQLKAEALPDGALKAKVSFRMPTLNAADGELKDGTLTATIKSAAETKTVSGTPGSEQTVEIATIDGSNEITVFASNANEGLEAKTSVFTGIDVPNPISTFKSGHTADFKGIHIEWEDPTTGTNGGYIDPTKITYALCIFNEEKYQWEIAQELGDVNSYDAYFEVPEKIALAQIGIVAQNNKGNCGTLLIVSGAVGTPFALPMRETFSESFNTKYEPMMGECPDASYFCEWGHVSKAYPYWIDYATPYGNGAYCVRGTNNQKARVVLPAFSTQNTTSAGIEIPLYAFKGKGEIKVYAKAYGIEPELIGIYEGTDKAEWTKCRFFLPSRFMNQKWVEIIIDGIFKAEEESTLAFAQYKIQTFYADDIAVMEMNAPVFPMVGNAYEITATVENAGLLTAEVPLMELQVVKGDKTLTSLSMTRTDGTGKLPELGQAEYKTIWTPDATVIGDVKLTVRTLNADMDPSNDSKTIEVSVGRGNTPVVTDLRADENTSNIALTWAEPTVETGRESFESFASFSYGDMIGDFKCVNLDGEEPTYFGNFNFPHQLDKKAWQVIGEKDITAIMEDNEIENTFLTSDDGDKFLIAFTPFTIYVGANLTSDRWIISPEIKGGSEFSFRLTPGVTGYVEPVEVLYSSSDDETSSFSMIEELKLLSTGWKEYKFTLPEDAKYFAIRYRGNTDSGFFVMLDDIRYVPAAESPVLEGYDIYRDGAIIAENVKAPGSYTDAFKTDGRNTYYNIKPVVRRNGALTRGLISNTAYVGQSGITEIEDTPDTEAKYYSLQGFRVMTPERGIYIKRKGGKASRVIIK